MNKAIFLFIFLLLFCNASLAWEHEIAAGYGYSKEINEDYTTAGYELTGKLYKFGKIDNTLIITIDGTLAHWYTTTPTHNETTIAAIAPSWRAYFYNFSQHDIRPYLAISFGPAYLSEQQLGNNIQGSHFAFQTTVEVGTEIATQQQHAIDLNLHLAHYCNAGLASPNEGFDIFYILTIGYAF